MVKLLPIVRKPGYQHEKVVPIRGRDRLRLFVLKNNRSANSRHIKCEGCIKKWTWPPIRPLPPYEETQCVAPLVGLIDVK